MKHRWKRRQPVVELDVDVLSELVGADVLGVERIATGLVNTIYRVDTREQRLCVKVGQRGEVAAQVEYAVCREVPRAPRPWAFAHRAGHPIGIYGWCPGVRLDVFAETASVEVLVSIVRKVGVLAAEVHRPVACTGFYRADLSIDPLVMNGAALAAYARAQLVDGPGGDRLGAMSADLLAWIDANGHVLDDVGEPVRCHGDLGPENLLVDGDDVWLLDWEFAFAGVAVADLGHMLRTPLYPSMADDLGAAYVAAGGSLPVDWAWKGQVWDLFAWLGFLGRPELGPEVVAAAKERIAVIIY